MSRWTNEPSTTTATVSNVPTYREQGIDSEQPGPSSPRASFTHCPLLHLPLEMRLDIYELALLDTKATVSSFTLLQTCHRINMEARPTLYKRPTSFPSQAKLFAWIDSSRKQDLKRVRTLTLRLTDIDLSPLLEEPSPKRQTRGSVWTIYQSELDRFDDALKALPNLSSLTITPPKPNRSQLFKGLYHSLLALIPQRCPKLKRFELQDGDEILEAVPALKDLVGLKCTGNTPRIASRRKSREAALEKRTMVNRVEKAAGERQASSHSREPSVSPRLKFEETASPRRKDEQGIDGVGQ